MIVFFSGTGNSHFVADRLAELLSEKCPTELRGEMLYDPMKCRLSAIGEKRIMWVFPTYSWGVPPVISRFISEVNFTGAQAVTHIMVTTCGDDIGQAASQWRKLIGRRKWISGAAYSVTMPNTYVLMSGFDVDSPELADSKLEHAPERIDEIAERIKNNIEGDLVTKGAWPRLKTSIIYPYFKKFCMSPKPFKSNGRCIGCGTCSRSCPMDNITMEEGRPKWHDRCALCLRCYHICPCDAIEYGKATKDKGQYFLK